MCALVTAFIAIPLLVVVVVLVLRQNFELNFLSSPGSDCKEAFIMKPVWQAKQIIRSHIWSALDAIEIGAGIGCHPNLPPSLSSVN